MPEDDMLEESRQAFFLYKSDIAFCICRTGAEKISGDLLGLLKFFLPVRVGLGPFRVTRVVWDFFEVHEPRHRLVRPELDQPLDFRRRPAEAGAIQQMRRGREIPFRG